MPALKGHGCCKVHYIGKTPTGRTYGKMADRETPKKVGGASWNQEGSIRGRYSTPETGRLQPRTIPTGGGLWSRAGIGLSPDKKV